MNKSSIYVNRNIKYFTTDNEIDGILKDYGVMYAKTCFPIGHKFEWLNYCALSSALPKDLKSGLDEFSNYINTTYAEHIVVKMDKNLIPGCVCEAEYVDEIAKDMYDGLCNLFKNLVNEENCIALVYGVGKIHDKYIRTVETTHAIEYYPIMIKVGRTIDSNKTPGIIKV